MKTVPSITLEWIFSNQLGHIKANIEYQVCSQKNRTMADILLSCIWLDIQSIWVVCNFISTNYKKDLKHSNMTIYE